MHSSLKRSTSLTIQAGGGIVVAIFIVLMRQGVVLPIMVGIVAGVVTGLMRRLAIRETAELLSRSRTSKEVRAAVASTPEGRISVGLIWIGVAAIAVITKLGGDQAFFYRFLAGFMALLVARESMAFSALRDVERLEGSGGGGQGSGDARPFRDPL